MLLDGVHAWMVARVVGECDPWTGVNVSSLTHVGG